TVKRSGAVQSRQHSAPNDRSKDGVDKRRDGAALGQDDESAADKQDEHQRQQPELLSGAHIGKQFAEKTHRPHAPVRRDRRGLTRTQYRDRQRASGRESIDTSRACRPRDGWTAPSRAAV